MNIITIDWFLIIEKAMLISIIIGSFAVCGHV